MSINSANQYRYTGKGPLDSNALVKTFADLISESTWQVVNGSGKEVITAYNGMVVAVWLDKDENKNLTDKNGIYLLFDPAVVGTLGIPEVTNEANWHKLVETSNLTSKLSAIDERITALEEAESDVITYSYRSGFPVEGEPNKLYVAADEGKTYIWLNNDYLLVGGASSEYEEPDEIHGDRTIIVLRNDKSTAWATSDVILREGELGVSYLENGNVIVKAGNGKDLFTDLPQVESVLESDMILTYSFGKHSVPTGSSLNAGGIGMTVSQWLADSLKKTIEPTIKRYPNASLSASCSNSGASLEIGSYITSISYSGSLSEDGAYETDGKETASGIKDSDLTWEVTFGDDTTTKKTTATGSYVTNIQINSTSNKTYATVKAKATLNLDNVVTPTNNLGEASATIKINGFDSSGTTVKHITADVKATGYRDTWYYIGTDCTTEIDSAFIRGSTSKGSTTYNFGTVPIPAGTTRVMFAVFGDKTLASVIDVDGMGLDVKENFTKKTIAVSGANNFEAANYSVFIAENPSGMAATRYTVTITN